jgi:hypothetical protein
LPRLKGSGDPRSINVCFILDAGPAWVNRIDDADWDAVEMALTSLKSRLEEGKDQWNVSVMVDSSYLSIPEDEERQILEVLKQKLDKFSAVLQLDIR